MQVKRVRPSRDDSHERIFHDAGLWRFLIDCVRKVSRARDRLLPSKLERSIGVIYRPETEFTAITLRHPGRAVRCLCLVRPHRR